jgi:ribosomal protein L37AE/L43A
MKAVCVQRMAEEIAKLRTEGEACAFMRNKIHKRKHPNTWIIALCGAETKWPRYLVGSNLWKKVTCKKCLKLKQS